MLGRAPAAAPAACSCGGAKRRTPGALRRARRRTPPGPVALHKGWGATHGAGARAASPAAPAAQQLLLEPDVATIELLTRLRDPRDVDGGLRPFLPPAALDKGSDDGGGGVPVYVVAGVPILEAGPLSRCGAFMDAASRRALPGHLLRRARVLSSLRIGSECLQRVAVTACSGEELVLAWRLRHTGLGAPHEGTRSAGDAGSARSSGGGGGDGGGTASLGGAGSGGARGDDGGDATSATPATGGVRSAWQLVSIARDAGGDAELSARPPPRPHPRLPPEAVVLAQLAALRRGALHEAAAFAVWGRHAGGGGWDAQMGAFRALLRDPQLHLCLTHDGAELGPGALPQGQRGFVQEVRLSGARGAAAARLLFRLNMHGDGCWLVRSFEAR